MSQTPHSIAPDLGVLASLFYPSLEPLGGFSEVSARQMPADYRRLLAHDDHMTVTVEAFHNSLVDLEVLQESVTETHYARQILLHRQSDQQVVQFGIMRASFHYLDQQVCDEIQNRSKPLGRTLIERDVLRRVRLAALWEVTPGENLCRLFNLDRPHTTYGRSALIECNHEPAVELVEIVAPLLQ